MQFNYRLVLALVCVAPVFGQWELGAVAGYGLRRNVPVENRSGTAGTLKLGSGLAWGVYAGQTEHGYLGGEAHYLYETSDLTLQSGTRQATAGLHAHVVHFDFLVHASKSRVRPFVAIGGGVKIYEGTGPDRAAQPLSDFVMLTRTRDVKPVITPAVGLKIRLAGALTFRAEARYFGSPRPEKIITPGPGASMKGWIHDIVPTVGFGATF